MSLPDNVLESHPSLEALDLISPPSPVLSLSELTGQPSQDGAIPILFTFDEVEEEFERHEKGGGHIIAPCSRRDRYSTATFGRQRSESVSNSNPSTPSTPDFSIPSTGSCDGSPQPPSVDFLTDPAFSRLPDSVEYDFNGPSSPPLLYQPLRPAPCRGARFPLSLSHSSGLTRVSEENEQVLHCISSSQTFVTLSPAPEPELHLPRTTALRDLTNTRNHSGNPYLGIKPTPKKFTGSRKALDHSQKFVGPSREGIRLSHERNDSASTQHSAESAQSNMSAYSSGSHASSAGYDSTASSTRSAHLASLPSSLQWLRNSSITLMIDQEGHRLVTPRFHLVRFSTPANLSTSTDEEYLGTAEFRPVKRYHFAFHYATLDSAPTLRRVLVNDDESRDYIGRQATLSVRTNGVYTVSGQETGSGLVDNSPNKSTSATSSPSSAPTLHWKFEYLVEDRRFRGKSIKGEKILTPISFSCSAGLLHPRLGRKVSILQVVRKTLTPNLAAERLVVEPPSHSWASSTSRDGTSQKEKGAKRLAGSHVRRVDVLGVSENARSGRQRRYRRGSSAHAQQDENVPPKDKPLPTKNIIQPAELETLVTSRPPHTNRRKSLPPPPPTTAVLSPRMPRG